MAFGFLKKIPNGIWAGIKKVDDVGDFIDNLPGGKNLLLAIPVAGPYLKMALDEVDFVEGAITGSGRGEEKLALALERLANKLKDQGTEIDASKLRGIVEGAVAVRNGEATIFDPDEQD